MMSARREELVDFPHPQLRAASPHERRGSFAIAVADIAVVTSAISAAGLCDACRVRKSMHSLGCVKAAALRGDELGGATMF
jgi:hypothetical protein